MHSVHSHLNIQGVHHQADRDRRGALGDGDYIDLMLA